MNMENTPGTDPHTIASDRFGIHPQEGTFLIPDLNSEPDPELVARGWERRFMAGPVRAKEAKQLYTELGYQVHLEPVKPAELDDQCQGCLLAAQFFVTLYTRKGEQTKD